MKRLLFTTVLLALLLMCSGVARGQFSPVYVEGFSPVSISCPSQNVFYSCGLEGKIFKSTDGGQSWYQVGLDTPDSNRYSFVLTRFYDDNEGFVVSGNRFEVLNQPEDPIMALFKTTDGGNTWILADSLHDFHDIQWLNMDTLIARTTGGSLLRSLDGGETWCYLPKPDPSMTVWDFCIAEGRIYAIYGASSNMNIYYSDDSAETWILANTFPIYHETPYEKGGERASFYGIGPERCLFMDDKFSGRVIGRRMYTTTDGFATADTSALPWQEPWAIQGSCFWALSYDRMRVSFLPSGMGCAVASGTDTHDVWCSYNCLLLTQDFGQHWSRMEDNYLWNRITDVQSVGDSTFWLVCHGYLDTLPHLLHADGGFPTSVKTPVVLHSLTIYPNPMDNVLRVAVTEGDAGIAHVEMFDMFGRAIRNSEFKIQNSNTQHFTIDASDIPSGVYVLRVTLTDGSVRTEKVVKD